MISNSTYARDSMAGLTASGTLSAISTELTCECECRSSLQRRHGPIVFSVSFRWVAIHIEMRNNSLHRPTVFHLLKRASACSLTSGWSKQHVAASSLLASPTFWLPPSRFSGSQSSTCICSVLDIRWRRQINGLPTRRPLSWVSCWEPMLSHL